MKTSDSMNCALTVIVSKLDSRNMQGYFEKDGKIFSFSYYQYVGVKDEVGKKLVNAVLSNLKFVE